MLSAMMTITAVIFEVSMIRIATPSTDHNTHSPNTQSPMYQRMAQATASNSKARMIVEIICPNAESEPSLDR